MTTPSVQPLSSGTALGALERYSESHDDPTTALREAVEALWTMGAQAAAEGTLDALRRRELVRRGTNALSTIIHRGVASGAFRPTCALWATRRLPHAIVAGLCARWAFGLSEERSLQAGSAAEAALEVLRPATRQPRSPTLLSQRCQATALSANRAALPDT